jgi:hypothetical protein
MVFTVMRLGGARRRSRGRGRVRCVNAGLSDKADDGSQKQNVFYHRLLLNTLKNAKFRKKICDTSARASDRCRAVSVAATY